MAIPAYMKIEGIPGSVSAAGREGCIEVLEFEYPIFRPTDRHDLMDRTTQHTDEWNSR